MTINDISMILSCFVKRWYWKIAVLYYNKKKRLFFFVLYLSPCILFIGFILLAKLLRWYYDGHQQSTTWWIYRWNFAEKTDTMCYPWKTSLRQLRFFFFIFSFYLSQYNSTSILIINFARDILFVIDTIMLQFDDKHFIFDMP